MVRIRFKRPMIGLCTSLILVSLLTIFSSSSIAVASPNSSFSFKNFELSSVPGTVCPNTAKTCTNGAAEPAIRSDPAGNFYASSENGVGFGTEAWKSTNGGKTYTTLVSPNGASQGPGGLAPGGGDTDVATAPVKNSQGIYNVYVASLTLANVDVSTSMDGGKTWALHPTSAKIPGDDREWIAAAGASKVCISYHDISTAIIHVDCSYDAGTNFTQTGTAFDAAHAPIFVQNNQIGNMAIDPDNHNIYQTWSSVHDVSEVPCGQVGTCGYHTVWMGVSTDGGKTFTDYIVYNNLNTSVSYGHQFVNVSVDKAGNVYSVYTDNHNVYYSYSKTHGTTWTGPFQVNKAPANTAIFPWSTANKAGHIDIVYYGTSYFNAATTPDNYPMSANWYAYMAQSLNATALAPSFTQVAATPIVHMGGVCESGAGCTGNRDLYDDFGVAVNPITGLASIVYSDDQYTNDANDPPASSSCTASTTNTGSCDHTSIATQLSGPGI